MTSHPLLAVLLDAARGRFPPVDGEVEILPPDPAGTWAIVEFTGHAYVLADTTPEALAEVGADGYGGAGHPHVQRLLAGPDGWIGCHDAVLARPTGGAGAPLAERTDLDGHPRVSRARQHRRQVTVYGNDDGLAVVGNGLAGRTEIAVELFVPGRAAGGAGRRLILGAVSAVTDQDWCFAQVSPGNAASLRAFLAAGFVPIGSEILIHPDRHLPR